jgi:uncharacterized protein with NRDE domain
MCTATFLPYKNGFLLTHNRDEFVERPIALPPQTYLHTNSFGENLQLTYPKDPKGGGTWILVAEKFTLCLLNGAFVPYIPTPPYRRSRGLVLLDFFDYQNIENFAANYNLVGIEPFTLWIIENDTNNTPLEFIEFRWDSQKLHQIKLDSKTTHIRSSTTLYTPEIIKNRETWFGQWLQENPHYDDKQIIDFHLFGGQNDKNSNLVMHRKDKLTVSITAIAKYEKENRMVYRDLVGMK